jgi:hypothetical protein
MRILWNVLPPERLKNLNLARRVGQMVVTTNDVGNFHEMIIDGTRKHKRGNTG